MKYYVYRHVDVDRPAWTPLQQVATRTTKRRDLPTIHPAEFMYMGHLRSREGEPDLHLYRHYDTRRYLNIDEQLRFFEFCFGEEEKPFFECDVYYRRLRGTAKRSSDSSSTSSRHVRRTTAATCRTTWWCCGDHDLEARSPEAGSRARERGGAYLDRRR